MRKHGKVDDTQDGIVKVLRGIGVSVEILSSVGDGFPDLLVGFRGQNILLECKRDSGKLTKDQLEWMAKWTGRRPQIVRSSHEALLAIGAIKQ